MHRSIEDQARDVLSAEPTPAVPLSRLHRTLVAEAGSAVGTYGQLHERLRRRPELFELVEPPDLPWDAATWPVEVRHQYRDALRRVGAVAEPRVALREPNEAPAPSASDGIPTVLRQLDLTLAELWTAAGDDAAVRTSVVEAMALADELRRASERSPARPEARAENT